MSDEIRSTRDRDQKRIQRQIDKLREDIADLSTGLALAEDEIKKLRAQLAALAKRKTK